MLVKASLLNCIEAEIEAAAPPAYVKSILALLALSTPEVTRARSLNGFHPRPWLRPSHSIEDVSRALRDVRNLPDEAAVLGLQVR